MTEATEPAVQSGLWDQLMALSSQGSMPSRQEFVNLVTDVVFFEAIVLVALGLVYLLAGWKAFKALMVANAVLAGALLGSMLGSHSAGQNMQIVGGLLGGLMLGIVAVPMMKPVVALMGGLAGSFMGYGLWVYVAGLNGNPDPVQNAWVGALVGLITLGMLAFLLFQETVVVVTALQGALLAVTGGLALAMKADSVRENLSRSLVDNVHFLPILIVVPTLIGIVFQCSGSAKLKKKKKAKQPAVA